MICIPNLLIVAGTGSKSGKTTIACRLIEQFNDNGIVAVRISPHFHEKSAGLNDFISGDGYAVYRETNPDTGKDTSRMLRAGADKVYLALVWNDSIQEVFVNLVNRIPGDVPVICESQLLRNFIEPGLFVIISSASEKKRSDINETPEMPCIKFQLEELGNIQSLPVSFRNGKWSQL
ncbi:MAG TPA: hypothetical protein VHO46_01650 [Bacteroidales bacterium]|nr:hypothetical protein [Bacteroidales bacterium]